MLSHSFRHQDSHAQSTLRIVTWNCCMALRKKWTWLVNLSPDIAVIQECETPDRWPQSEYTSAIWHGHNKHKGLAIVTFGPWRLEEHEQLDPSIEYVLPARVIGPKTFNVLGVWTKASPIKGRSYIGQMRQAVQVYGCSLDDFEAALSPHRHDLQRAQ